MHDTFLGGEGGNSLCMNFKRYFTLEIAQPLPKNNDPSITVTGTSVSLKAPPIKQHWVSLLQTKLMVLTATAG